jgi:MFS family permease
MVTAVRYAASSRPHRALLACTAVFSLMAASVPALLPVLAKDGLHTSATGYGMMLGALGAGAVTGALLLRRVREMLPARTLIAGAMALYGASVTAMTFAPTLPLAVAALFPAGVGWLGTYANLNALVQLSSPRWVRARAMAIYQLSYLVAWSVGATVGGALASRAGAGVTIRLAALGACAAAIVPSIVRLPSYEDDADLRDVPTPAPISAQ